MTLRNGELFAGYRIERQLGAGGMGEVYVARHPRLPRWDAIKILPAGLTNDEQFRERFNREADLAATLYHAHIVGVHDRGEVDGQLWISMDFVDGVDASTLIGGRSDSDRLRDVVDIVGAVAEALDFAHVHQLLHRDVKPANILLTTSTAGRRRILLADFGIARRTDDVSGLTSTNIAVGTVNYAAPEQLMGEALDGRADQYALAATAYHLLSGRPPFAGSNPTVVISKHLTAAPPAISDACPEFAVLDAVLARGLAKGRADRYHSCVDFATAFRSAAGGIIAAFDPSGVAASRNSEDSAHPTQAAVAFAAAPTQQSQTVAGKACEQGEPESKTATSPKQARWRRRHVMAAVAGAVVVVSAVSAAAIALRPSSPASAPTLPATTKAEVAPRFDPDQCKTSADANRDIGCTAIATSNSLDIAWGQLVPEYTRASLELFTGATDTACGAMAGIPAAYCAGDLSVHIDVDFPQDLVDQFEWNTGQLATEYVVAHMYGHHIQHLRMAKDGTQATANEHERTELQADCYAGVWAHHAATVQAWITPLAETGIRDIMSATASLGASWKLSSGIDGAYLDFWIYSSADRRSHWFSVGYEEGDPDQCNTYAAASLDRE